MSKLDAILRAAGGNIDESMGRGMSPAAAPPGLSLDQAQRLPERLKGVAKVKNVAEVALAKIDRDPDQPREEFDEEALERLAESIHQRGLLQPIRVRWDEGRGVYIVVVGERRWRAARRAGLETIPCVIVEGTLDPGELLAIQLVENALREDLRPIEQARAYKRLMEAKGWSARQLARELAIDNSSVIRALALLELPEPVQAQVDEGELAPSVAYEVAKLDDAAAQVELAEQVVAERLTRGEVVEAVKARRASHTGGTSRPRAVRVEYAVDGGKVTVTVDREGGDVEAMLEQALAQHRAGGREAA